MKSPTDSVDDFQKRINQKARADKDDKPEGDPTIDWYLGLARDRGSLHSDFWTGTAAALAECGMIAVYPVGGWWKEQPKRDRSALGARYTLVISLETDAEKVDIWTPVATEVGIPAVATAIEL